MRASSLSDKEVVDLLSRYFVSVWLSTDDFELAPKDKAEAEVYTRYLKLAKAQGLASGTVQVYVIMPDGTLLTTLHVAKALQPETLRALLTKTVEEHHLEARAAGAAAKMRPRQRPRQKDVVEFHFAARNLGPRSKWGLGENWVPFRLDECTHFVPREARKDFAWQVPAATANKVFLQLFPPGPNYVASNGTVEESSLAATVAAIDGDHALIRLRGSFRLNHRVGGKTTDGEVRARVSGYALVDAKARKLTELALITDDADLVWHWQGKPQPSKFTAFVEFDAQ